MTKILSQLEQLKEIALDLLFPSRCVSCGSEGEFICASCRRLLPRILPPLCPRCGKPLPEAQLCSGCRGWQAQIEGIRSPFRFEGVARQAIHELKYQNLKVLAPHLAELLQGYLSIYPLPGEVLVPVPLHPRRLRGRGYNQSGLLARELGRLVSLPVVEGSIHRMRNTPPQARSTSMVIRQSNVAGAFACRDQHMKQRQVLLIDDVCTTGATLNACAVALRAAGAASVWGLTLAREI
ncbi:ComF family protein [Chloroflexota bacterium]